MSETISRPEPKSGPATITERVPAASRPQAAGPRVLPLEGVRVLDFSQVMAGPFCAMLLADLGADVVKIEPPTGDQTRSSMGFKMKGPDSMGFLNMNRNKRSIVLDLKTEGGRAAFHELARSADIVIENYRPGVVKKLGVDYETLRPLNPALIYASISGFGQSGPWADRPGFDLMAQAMSGVMSVTGHPGMPPVKAGVPVADIGCALFCVYAILSAYIGRERSGEGQYIDASLFEAALAFSIWDTSEYWGTGVVPGPVGTSNKMSAPYQAVEARDGHFVMGANNQRLFQRLCETIGRTELLQDPRFQTNALRLNNREILIEELERTFKERDADEWVEEFLRCGIPAGKMATYAEAYASEHAAHRNMRLEVPHPIEGTVPNIGFPVKLSGTPQEIRRHAPLLGEHSEEILREAGLAPERIAALRAEGALGQ